MDAVLKAKTLDLQDQDHKTWARGQSPAARATSLNGGNPRANSRALCAFCYAQGGSTVDGSRTNDVWTSGPWSTVYSLLNINYLAVFAATRHRTLVTLR